MQAVVAVRQIPRQLPLDDAVAAVLQHQIGAAVPPAVAAGDEDAHGVRPVVLGRLGVRIGPHRGFQGGARLVRGRVRGAGGVVEAGDDAERIGLGVLAFVYGHGRGRRTRNESSVNSRPRKTMAQLRKISMNGFSKRGIRSNVAVRPSSENSD